LNGSDTTADDGIIMATALRICAKPNKRGGAVRHYGRY